MMDDPHMFSKPVTVRLSVPNEVLLNAYINIDEDMRLNLVRNMDQELYRETDRILQTFLDRGFSLSKLAESVEHIQYVDGEEEWFIDGSVFLRISPVRVNTIKSYYSTTYEAVRKLENVYGY